MDVATLFLQQTTLVSRCSASTTGIRGHLINLPHAFTNIVVGHCLIQRAAVFFNSGNYAMSAVVV